jgi:amidase
MQGARIGVSRNFFGFDPRVDKIMQDCIEVIRRLGAEVIDPANIETGKQLEEAEYEVLLYEFKADLNAYLARLGPQARVQTLADIIEFNERHQDKVMPYFGQDIMIKSEAKGPLTEDAYQKALETDLRLARDEGIDATLQKYHLDAIIAPSGSPARLTDLVNGNAHGGGGSSSPAAVAGYASITVPAGYIFGLPVGLSFIGGAYQEPTLIKLAYAFEQATHFRKPPGFMAHADLNDGTKK